MNSGPRRVRGTPTDPARAASRRGTGVRFTDISVTPLVERIARVLAAQHISAGREESAGRLIDANWPDYRDDALPKVA